VDILTQDKLALFIAFFIPGFIIFRVYGLLVPSAERDFTKLAPDAVAYSCMHYAITAWPLFFIPAGGWRNGYLYFDVLLLPALWPLLFLTIRRLGNPLKVFSRECAGVIAAIIGEALSIRDDPTPWDRLFRDRKDWYIRIRTKTGRFIGGRMMSNSYTSLFPQPTEIFVSEAYKMDAETANLGIQRLGPADFGSAAKTSNISSYRADAIPNLSRRPRESSASKTP
jgi:uncharacterized protein DUF6338